MPDVLIILADLLIALSSPPYAINSGYDNGTPLSFEPKKPA